MQHNRLTCFNQPDRSVVNECRRSDMIIVLCRLPFKVSRSGKVHSVLVGLLVGARHSLLGWTWYRTSYLPIVFGKELLQRNSFQLQIFS